MAVRLCRWCETLVPEEATACPACGGLDLEPATAEQEPREMNPLAVPALVLAVLWLGGLGSLAAVIMGSTARVQIAERHQQGEGVALAAVVVGAAGLIAGALLLGTIALVVAL